MSRVAPGRARRIALLIPMYSELRPLIHALDLVRSREPGSQWVWRGAGGVEVVAALTGMGMRKAAERTALMLDSLSPDHVVVVGIAGAIGAGVAIGDLVVPERVLNLDTGSVSHPTRLGVVTPRGTLASSDGLLEDPHAVERLKASGVLAIDMETAAVAGICEERACPWSVFRAISDRADDGTTDAAVLGLAHPDGRPNLAAVARFLLTRPRRLPQLVRLGRDAHRAARVAATAAAEALATVPFR